MAGFFKKVFSFGKKAVEERPAEDEPLKPIDWSALQSLTGEKADAAEEAAVAEISSSPLEKAPPVPVPDLSSPQPGEGGEATADPGAPPSGHSGHFVPVGEKSEPPAPTPETSAPIEEPAPPAEPDVPAEEPPVPEVPEPPPELERTPEPPAVQDVSSPQRAEGGEATAEPVALSSGLSGHLLPVGEKSQPPAPTERELAAPAEEPAPPAEPDVPAEEPPVPEVPEPPPEPERTPEPPAVQDVSSPQRAEGGEATAESGEGASTPSSPVAASSGPEPALGLAKGETQVGHLPPIGEKSEPAVGKAGKVTVARTVEQKTEPAPVPEPVARKSWFQRMREGLARSSRELTGNIAGVFTKRKLDDETLQDLEDILIRADLGVETALRVTDSLASSRYGKTISDEEVRTVMAVEIGKVLTPVAKALELDLTHKPHVVLVVGVNGTGKTTTIGKLAAKLTQGGLSVMLAAGDTFRAAAIEQLKIWGERTNSPVVASKLGADAAGLAYDAFVKAKEAGSDVLIIDTAGRLQNKTELMAELEKIVRVLGKLDPEAPHTVLQTVDATTGQNALNQVEIFRNVAGVNGLVMTKLDGTARGGILVAIAAKHKLPVYFIGVGEQVDDLEPFSASEFARAIAGVA